MKKVVEIVTTTRVEINIPDEILTDRSVQLFSEHMWEIKSPNEIYDYAANQIQQGFEGYNLDFIGLLGKQGVTYGDGKQPDVSYKIISEDVDIQHE